MRFLLLLVENAKYEDIANKILFDYPEYQDKFIEIGKLHNTLKNTYDQEKDKKFAEELFQLFINTLASCIENIEEFKNDDRYSDYVYDTIETILKSTVDRYKISIDFANSQKQSRKNIGDIESGLKKWDSDFEDVKKLQNNSLLAQLLRKLKLKEGADDSLNMFPIEKMILKKAVDDLKNLIKSK